MSYKPDGQLLRSAPYFPVADLERSVEHYQRVLGFHLDYLGGTPAHFAILSRDGLPLPPAREARTYRICIDPAKRARRRYQSVRSSREAVRFVKS